MAINPPPIQEKTTDQRNGLFPQVWSRWFQSLWTNIHFLLSTKVIWFDNNDVATHSTPISHTGGASDTYLTNDGLGVFSNSYNISSYFDIWDTSNNHFDFSGLKIGDTVSLRVDLSITTSVNNQEFNIIMDNAIGSGSDYSLNIFTNECKNQGTYQATFLYEVYIGNTITQNYPSKLRFGSDGNASIVVNGWFTRLNIA